MYKVTDPVQSAYIPSMSLFTIVQVRKQTLSLRE